MPNLERQDEILAILSKENLVTVASLAKKLYVSEATIRRDLLQMHSLGLIRRTHGGAMKIENNAHESSFAMRESDNLTAKKVICTMALQHISDNSTIYMDSSSTIFPIIPMLHKFQHLTVITHGLKTALMLSNLGNVEVYIAGGRIENFSNSILGTSVVEFYDQINADVALMSGSGINDDGAITDNSIENAKIKKKIISKSKKVLMLIDTTKFDRTFMNTSCHIRDIDYLLTDKKPDDKYIKHAQSSGCKIVNP